MCGISYYSHIPTKHQLLKNRGPDAHKCVTDVSGIYDFYRLAIVGDEMQPFTSIHNDKHTVLMCNGEIYNHVELWDGITPYTTDCSVLLPMFLQEGIEAYRKINGEFSFIYTDGVHVYFARDRLGRKALYYSYSDGHLQVSSVIASLTGSGFHVIPGCIYRYHIETKELHVRPIHTFDWMSPVKTKQDVYDKLVEAVKVRVTQSHRRVGFMLSGGLDSSLLLAIAIKYGFIKNPPVFTIAFTDDSSDLAAAKSVVAYLKEQYGDDACTHHIVRHTVEEAHEFIPTVIKALETFDTTTVRASVPMWLLSRYIKEKTDVRVVISGEGSDELFGGYLYFQHAPNVSEWKKEIISLLSNLYQFDCLRADRATADNSLEVRCPFLDDRVVDDVMASDIAPGAISKEWLRQAIPPNTLPEAIVWGKKEAFSDAVGYSWKDSLEEYARTQKLPHVYSQHIVPTTHEAKFYQSLFYHLVGPQFRVVEKLWMPNATWVSVDDPSARCLTSYSVE